MSIDYAEAGPSVRAAFDAAIDSHKETAVVRPGGGEAVVVSRDDYESLKETAYLLSAPANAARLLRSMAQLDAGYGNLRELVD